MEELTSWQGNDRPEKPLDPDATKQRASKRKTGQHTRSSNFRIRSQEDVSPTFGRRRYDPDSGSMVTKRLVVITVVLVDALYLAGDALLTNGNICP